MSEITLVQSLTQQAPGIVGVIIVVILFLRAIAARDEIFIKQMDSVSARLADLELIMADHDATSKADRERRADTLDRIERLLRERQRAQITQSRGGRKDESSGI